MPRIRSVHPGLWTDEAFVAMSDAACLLLIGLGNEADDQGVFEWKPVTIKVRLRPAKDGSVEPLLDELVAAGWLRRFEVGGRPYAAIRNFKKHQRPQKPTAIHPLPDELRDFVEKGLVTHAGSPTITIPTPPGDAPATVRKRQQRARVREMVSMEERELHDSGAPSDDDYGSGTGMSQQREDGEEDVGKEEEDSGGADAPQIYAFAGRVIRLKATDLDRWRKSFSAIPDLVAELQAADAFYAEKPPKDGKWFFPVSNWLKRAHEAALKAKSAPDDAEARIYRGID